MITHEDATPIIHHLEAKGDPVSVEAAAMLHALLVERDAAFKAGEDAMRDRAAHMIERAGKGTNIQFVTDVMGVAIRALANQPPARFIS